MELLFILIFILLLAPTAYASVIGAPLAITDKRSIKRIIDELDMKSGEYFYELGTGTGRVISAVSERKDIKTVGFELSPIFYFLTFLKIGLKKNAKLHYGNFFKANLNKADVIFVFLMPKTLEKLRAKLSAELKPGSKIISYCFPIKDWSAYKTIKEENKPVVYFYEIK